MERQNHDDHLNFNKYYPLKFSFLELAFHVNSYKGNFFFFKVILVAALCRSQLIIESIFYSLGGQATQSHTAILSH